MPAMRKDAPSGKDFSRSFDVWQIKQPLFARVPLFLWPKKKMPDLRRPYRVPGIALGAPLSILVYLVMMTQLTSSAVVSGIVWSVFGMALFYGYRKYKGVKVVDEGISPANEANISADDKSFMGLSIIGQSKSAAPVRSVLIIIQSVYEKVNGLKI